MKKYVLYFIVACLFVSCKGAKSFASLTINNQTSADLTEVSYNGESFSTAVGETDFLGNEQAILSKGTSATVLFKKKVPQGYIFFTKGRVKYRTKEVVALNKGNEKTVTLTDNTGVVKLD